MKNALKTLVVFTFIFGVVACSEAPKAPESVTKAAEAVSDAASAVSDSISSKAGEKVEKQEKL